MCWFLPKKKDWLNYSWSPDRNSGYLIVFEAVCAQYFSKGISSVSLEASAYVCTFIFVFILPGLSSNALHSGESCVAGISSSLYTPHSILTPFHSWTFETAAMTTGHIEMAAEAKPSSCHRFAEVPVLREILTCATSNVLPVQHSSIYPSCTPLSSPSG